ncbi:ADP-heptose:LPS heptosyltransferase [Luteibacter jiangsuensis]|uniref:ADP-heptose:LPS heptosyltransferase n=1 Tax=Luteibacter jiangsuensis TaxID=637577 RepID=A0ABT9STK0_9GAMM|nr:glycosyltransferase family 9 protein [Luteibacter jiangsuensis]MDQ0008324.1 ADP-heptose:LPS heptosyltransferase [Luteibacter jiangsuensis]
MTAPDPTIGHGIYRILVCRPNHRLGNTLLLTPLITELQALYRGAEIDIVSEGDIAHDVFKGCFNVRQVFCLPRRGFKHPIAFLRMILRIRRTRYDLVVDPSVHSGFARALTRIFRGRYKLGFSDTPTKALTHAAPKAVAGRHMAKRPVNLVRWASGIDSTAPNRYPPLAIHLNDDEHAEGWSALTALTAHPHGIQGSLRIGIFGNATGAKRYTTEWWADFMATLCAAHPTASILEIIPAHGHSMLRETWPGYYSSDIRRMAAVLAGLDLFITADCGVMHLGVAAGVPTIGLFQVTALDVYTPYGGHNTGMYTGEYPGSDVARRVLAMMETTRAHRHAAMA